MFRTSLCSLLDTFPNHDKWDYVMNEPELDNSPLKLLGRLERENLVMVAASP